MSASIFLDKRGNQKRQIVTSLFLLLLLILSVFAKAQIIFTQEATRYLTEEEYKKLLREGAREAAANKGVPLSVFDENYTLYRNEILSTATPLIIKKFRWIEDGYSTQPAPGSKSFNNRKKLYEKELKRGVRDAILNDETLVKKLFELNEDDRIISFHSDVNVGKNGTLTVKETIKIYNGKGGDNDLIQRGITREFPTRYSNKYGLATSVPFKLKNTKRNGKEESYKSEDLINGIRLYFGKNTEYLERGYYTYEITYETANQLIFHKDQDELYWNVNGTGWKFNTGTVSCTIRFPEGAKITGNNCYTGIQGSKAQACNFTQIKDNVVSFSSTEPLGEYEGMTISTVLDKGILASPPIIDYWINLLKENYILPALVAAVLLLFLINFMTWWRIGRDPKGGTVIPQFAPPAGLSPADCGYLLTQKYKPNLFGASIVDYAVNRLVDIEVKKEGLIFKTPVYYFKKPASKQESNTDHQRYEWYGYNIDSLWGDKAEKGKYNANIAGRNNNLQNRLEERWLIKDEKKATGLFALNDNYIGLGFLFMFFCGFGTLIYFCIFRGLWLLIGICAGLVVSGFIMQSLFMKWMSAYTKEGRKILDGVLGFKKYLEVTEERMFDTMNPPEKNLQLFEKYLPYAIALECENEWGQKFERIIDKAIQGGYQPAYFHSYSNHFSSSSFASEFSGGISSTVASASTPPSSSSGGSSSGGFSGGGGGGGGGGGW